MPTPRGYQPTEVERMAQRARCQRLYRARRDDARLGLPADAAQVRRLLRRLVQRLQSNPLPDVHPVDAQVVNDALALAMNEVTVVASILTTQNRSAP